MAKRRRGAGRPAAEEGLDELYRGDFEDFVARRNELAKRLRAREDQEAADRVRALKKPSRVAWAINQVSARETNLCAELLDAGATLREAQEQLVAGNAESADLREASGREQAVVSKALDAVGALSEGVGAKLSPAALERARKTLHAVALDEGVRHDFERHRLGTEHEPAGLGGFSLGAAPPRRRGAGKAPPAKIDERQEAKRRRDERKTAQAEARRLGKREQEAEREVEAARETAKQAQRQLKRATKALDRAAGDASAARDRVSALR